MDIENQYLDDEIQVSDDEIQVINENTIEKEDERQRHQRHQSQLSLETKLREPRENQTFHIEPNVTQTSRNTTNSISLISNFLPAHRLSQLISRYCPYFYFQSGDPHHPISWETLLRSSQVLDLEGNIALGNADIANSIHNFDKYCVASSDRNTSRMMGDMSPIENTPYHLRMLRKLVKKSKQQREAQCLVSTPIWNGVRWGMYLTYWMWIPNFRSYRLLDRRFFQRNNSSPLRYTCDGRQLSNPIVQQSIQRNIGKYSHSNVNADNEITNEIGYYTIDPFHSDAPWIRHPGVITIYLECDDIQDVEGKSLGFNEFAEYATSLRSLDDNIKFISPRLLRVFMSNQGCGRWYRPEDCEMEAGRVSAYAVEGNAGGAWCPYYEDTRIFSMRLGCSKREHILYDPVDNIVGLVSPHHPAYDGEINGGKRLFYFSGIVGNEVSPVFVPQLQMPWLMLDKSIDNIHNFREKTWPQMIGRCSLFTFFFVVWTYGSVEPFVVIYMGDNYPFILMIITRCLVVLSSLIFTKIILN